MGEIGKCVESLTVSSIRPSGPLIVPAYPIQSGSHAPHLSLWRGSAAYDPLTGTRYGPILGPLERHSEGRTGCQRPRTGKVSVYQR